MRAVVESSAEAVYAMRPLADPSAKWQVRNADFSGNLSRFEVFCENELWAEFQTPLLGEFNLLNCLAVIVAADAWDVSKEKIQSALASFQNVKRRAEVRGEERGVVVIEDVALIRPLCARRALLRPNKDRRLIAVFEPLSWSSRLAGFKDFLMPLRRRLRRHRRVFDSQKVTEKVNRAGTLRNDAISQKVNLLRFPDADQIVPTCSGVRTGDVSRSCRRGFAGSRKISLPCVAAAYLSGCTSLRVPALGFGIQLLGQRPLMPHFTNYS